MVALPYDYYLIAWLALAAVSTAYVAFDQFNGNPEPTVMKWGFIIVTLYMGPFGLLLYVLADKEPHPGEHEQFTSPLWKQSIGSTIHCVAGDPTGIILAAVVTASLGLPMWIDLIVEYIAGFSFGLFIFQSPLGQRYDVIWTARKPGKWLVHCHIPHHTSNNNVEQHGGGGLMLVLNVQ